MILYRITKCMYTDLSGLGAKLYGGRWNSEGRPMVYLTSSRSLGMLEALAHFSPTNLPTDYCMMSIDVPENFMELPIKSLPKNWHEYPEQNSTKQIGNRFLQDKKYLLLKVPSAIVPDEYNYLLNPMHPEAATVKIISSQPFHFDPRLTAH
ncbi:MAG: RES family NAD+ phosphorylase [Mucilaginibacter sp.]